jgi:hypothetical protein
VTHDEGKMKFSFQFSLTYGVPPILVSDGGQEVVCDLVTECPFVRECRTGSFEKRVKCVTLFVNGEGKVGDVEKRSSGGDILVEIMEQKCFRVFRLMSRDGGQLKRSGVKKWSGSYSPSGV